MQRLENGNTLITELGKKPRLMEVDREGKIVVEVPLQPETDNAHMQTRMARQFHQRQLSGPAPAGIQSERDTPDGKVVKQFATDMEDLGGRVRRTGHSQPSVLKRSHAGQSDSRKQVSRMDGRQSDLEDQQ